MSLYKTLASIILTLTTLGTGPAAIQTTALPTQNAVANKNHVAFSRLYHGGRFDRKTLPITVFVNGKKITIPFALTRFGHEVAVPHLLPLFRELGWRAVYNPRLRQLALQVPGYKGELWLQGKGGFLVTVNGHPFLRTNPGVVGLPLAAFTLLLQNLGVKNVWQPGKHLWQIILPSSVPPQGANTGNPATNQGNAANLPPTAMVNTFNSNGNTGDESYWQAASPDFYLTAQTDDPVSANPTATSLLNAAPNQTLYLFAFSDRMNIPNWAVSWRVDSPDATVATVPQGWTIGNYQAAEATFVASKPGVYTVQAEIDGTYSVPLVITVGMDQLQSKPYAISPAQSGIQPLPANLPAVASSTQAGVTYTPYPAEQNWIPVSGSTDLPLAALDVVLINQAGDEWTYRLPVVNGKFSAMLEAPFTGPVTVVLFPNYFQALTASTRTNSQYSYPNSYYTVQATGKNLDSVATALLPSAERDYNMSPKYAQTADVLLENSPSLDTAIAAIANYASESIAYNQQELQTSNYLWQDSWSAWQSGSGVCEDYASLAAALLDSVAIPTQTIGGWANESWTAPPATDNNPDDAHEWEQAWDGSRWVVFDPTWNADDQASVPHFVSNQYFTDTDSLSATHLADPSQAGQDY